MELKRNIPDALYERIENAICETTRYQANIPNRDGYDRSKPISEENQPTVPNPVKPKQHVLNLIDGFLVGYLKNEVDSEEIRRRQEKAEEISKIKPFN